MAGFSGFTEDEILRFKMQGQSFNPDETSRQEPVKKAAINSSGKRAKPREKVRTRPSNTKTSSRPVKDGCDRERKRVEETQKEAKPIEEIKSQEKRREVEVVMEPEKVKELEMSNLEKMQQRQKEMEMVNKQKEKMLQTTLKQRYARTKKETETLKLVQKELSHLDNLLYTDVQILRDKIDQACREFDAARKRYNRAEAEFINAKLNLHEKTETKDQLTEHLCSIIQQNEERKAKKLAELMAKLEIDDEAAISVAEDNNAIEKNSSNDSTTVDTNIKNVETRTEKQNACTLSDENSNLPEASGISQGKGVDDSRRTDEKIQVLKVRQDSPSEKDKDSEKITHTSQMLEQKGNAHVTKDNAHVANA